jgi:hypothetical protein
VDQDSDKLVIEVETTRHAAAGAAAAYLLRVMAARAGCYAPGLSDRLFRDLQLERNGADVELVARWFDSYGSELARQGYRVLTRRVAFRTPTILGWVEGGLGFRGAVVPTASRILHPEASAAAGGHHAVALATGDGDPSKPPNGLYMIDPWPGATPRSKPPDNLEAAHREKKYAALCLYWAGYS